MSYSLRARLLLISGLVFAVFFFITGLILNQAYFISAKNSAKERLKLHTYSLLSVAEPLDGKLYIPDNLQLDRFNQPDSGLYAIVMNNQGDIIWQSKSARGVSLYYGEPVASGTWVFGTAQLKNKQSYLVSNYGVKWSFSDGVAPAGQEFFTVAIVENTETAYEGVVGYRLQLFLVLGVSFVIAIALVAITFRLGLKPLYNISKDLKKIESGEINSLAGNYPKELAALINNLNQLIASELRQRDRYRKTMADLAHSLKTPLAVLKNLSDSGSPANGGCSDEVIQEQLERMDNIISYQLKRAVVANDSLNRKAVFVAAEVSKIVSALGKVYREKDLQVEVKIPNEVYFRGDENDLLEMLGNLIDNAFKYAQRKVSIAGSEVGNARERMLRIVVEDDGAGIPTEQQGAILKRGARLDTMEPGQGIGLAMTANIVHEYDGDLTVNESSLGGSQFKLELPLPS